MVIKTKNIIPKPISESGAPDSDIWFKDLELISGNKYLITSESGAGKTSFLSILYGVRKDYLGEILFDNVNIKHLNINEWTKFRNYNLSYVFQGLRLFDDLSALDNILLKNKLTKYKSKKEILDLIDKVGLSQKINSQVKYLSFGQKQRLAIIRALCQPLNFLFLDEPFSHLDEKNIKIITEIINSELEIQNAGLVLTSLGNEYLFSYDKKLNL